MEAVDIYKNGEILLKQPKITIAIMGNVPVRQGCSFKKCTWKQGFPNQQNGIPLLIVMWKPPEVFKVVSLKDSLQNANEKLKT